MSIMMKTRAGIQSVIMWMNAQTVDYPQYNVWDHNSIKRLGHTKYVLLIWRILGLWTEEIDGSLL